MQCFINVLRSLEDMRTVPNEFSQEDERKRGEREAYKADSREYGKERLRGGACIWPEDAEALFVDQF